MSLTNRILLAMLAGITLGSALEWLMGVIDPESGLHGFIQNGLILGFFDVLGRIFIASLKLLVVPLVMVSLICGMSSLGASSRMGSIAGRTIALYLFTTGVAVSFGLTAAMLLGPGNGIEVMTSAAYEAKAPPPLTDTLVNIFPSNPFKAMADGQMLQVIVFALLVGFALTRSGEAGERIANWFRDMEVIVMKMVGILIELAPYGVFALLTKLFATMGFGTIVDLAAYFFTLLGVLLFHGLVVYTTLLKTLTGLSPRSCCKKCDGSGPLHSPQPPRARRSLSPCALSRSGLASAKVSPVSRYPWAPPSTWMAPPSCRAWRRCLLPRSMA
ncbi:MAG: hypothetical protein CM15mP89_3650 [Gammaproteobacteria bacterium]|nr:MAG: hypothetical protein CM15mP89_3650 [Gammaproteobacteria bacterium]